MSIESPDRSAVKDSTSLATWFHEIPASDLNKMLQAAVQHAAYGLAGMVKHPVHITTFHVDSMPITQVPTYAGNPEAEMVGIYLLIRGGLEGQALLLLPPASAQCLVSLLLDTSPATDPCPGQQAGTDLDILERSALAEVGNLMASYFLNAVAASLGKSRVLYPSPPAVMVDVMGAMLDAIATPMACWSDDLLVVACGLQVDGAWERMVQVHFWILPEPAILSTDMV